MSKIILRRLTTLEFVMQLALAGSGVVLATLGIIAGGYRSRWVLTFGRVAAIPWLLFIPLGTFLAAVCLVYLRNHRTEFVTVPDASQEAA